MNAPVSRAALTARDAPLSTAARAVRHPGKPVVDLSVEKMAFYADALESVIELARIARAVNVGEATHTEHRLFVHMERVRAHCALAVEEVYRLMNDDKKSCDPTMAAERRYLSDRCEEAMGFRGARAAG